MLSHVYLYRLKILLREKSLVFWILVFPFILSTLFHLVFSGFNGSAPISPIRIAVVDNEAYRQAPFLSQTLTAVSQGDSRFLDLVLCSDETEAEGLLKQEKIRGFVLVADPIQWHVAQSGLGESMVKSFLDQYAQISQAVETVMKRNPSALSRLLGQLGKGQDMVKPFRSGGPKVDLILVLFYALLAMSCLYGSFYGLSLVMDLQGNLSVRGARVNMAPMQKSRMFLAGMLAAFTVHLAGLLLFLAYLKWLLGVDFGGRGLLVLATMILGSVTGIFMGVFVGLTVRGKVNFKIAFLSTITLLGAFLSGMMAPQVKYQISTLLPLLSWLNPVNLLADSFYALYYYDDFQRYAQNMGMLLVFGFTFGVVAYLIIRRRQYVSL